MSKTEVFLVSITKVNELLFITSPTYRFCWQYAIKHSYRDTGILTPTIGRNLISFNFLLSPVYRKDCLACNWFSTIQSVLSININSPCKKLLVWINQSFTGYLIDAKDMWILSYMPSLPHLAGDTCIFVLSPAFKIFTRFHPDSP